MPQGNGGPLAQHPEGPAAQSARDRQHPGGQGGQGRFSMLDGDVQGRDRRQGLIGFAAGRAEPGNAALQGGGRLRLSKWASPASVRSAYVSPPIQMSSASIGIGTDVLSWIVHALPSG